MLNMKPQKVITMNESDAYDIYRLLKNRQLPVSYMDRDTSVFKKGMTVTTFYLAKRVGIRSGLCCTGKRDKSSL